MHCFCMHSHKCSCNPTSMCALAAQTPATAPNAALLPPQAIQVMAGRAVSRLASAHLEHICALAAAGVLPVLRHQLKPSSSLEIRCAARELTLPGQSISVFQSVLYSVLCVASQHVSCCISHLATAAFCNLEVLFLAMPPLHQSMGTNFRPHTLCARRDAAWLACNMTSAAEVVPALLAAPGLLQQVANVALDADLPLNARTYALRGTAQHGLLRPATGVTFHLFVLVSLVPVGVFFFVSFNAGMQPARACACTFRWEMLSARGWCINCVITSCSGRDQCCMHNARVCRKTKSISILSLPLCRW